MATKMMMPETAEETTPATLTPVQLDPRMLDVRRRLADATTQRDGAMAKRKTLQATYADPTAPELDRLEAELALPAAIRAEREAEAAVLRAVEQERSTEAAVRAELTAILDPLVRAAAFDVVRDLEAIKTGSHAWLVRVLDEVLRVTGRAHPHAAAVAWPIFVASQPGQEDLVAYRRRYVAQLGWIED